MKVYLKLMMVSVMIFTAIFLVADWQDLSYGAKKHIRSANLHYSGKRFEKAKPLYQKVLEDNPEHLESLQKLASIYFEIDKDYMKAHELYNKIVSLIDSVQNKYDSLQATDEDAAEDFYKDYIRKMDLEEKRENAVKFKDYCWTKMFVAAQDEVQKENYEKALEDFTKVYEVAPDSLKTIKMLSFIHTKLGNSEKSLEYMKLAAKADPKDDMVRTQIANEYFNMGNFEKAIEWYTKSAEINPQNVDNHHNLAVAYMKTKNDSGVVEAYKNVIELEPDNIEAIIYISNYAAKLGDNEEAIKYLEKAHELDPENEEYLKFLCYRSFQAKEYEKILKYGQLWFDLTETSKKEAAQFVYRAAKQLGKTDLESKYEKILTDLK